MPRPRSVDPTTTDLSTDGRPNVPGLIDRFGRTANDLRVSLTDFCNLRCTYCMPEMGMEFLKKNQLMSVDEIVRLVRIGVEHLGVDQVRFTGGEPLTRPDLAEIIAGVAALEPRPNIALTTNAIGLDIRAQELVDAGLDRINVSLDSVVSETFEAMSRRPLLHRVLAGLEGAQAAGLDPIKVNAVLQPGVNDHEAPDLLQWCLDRGFELRIIEYMPIDGGKAWNRTSMITAADVHAILSGRFLLTPTAEPRGSAPAETFQVRLREAGPDSEVLGTVGVIASVTQPFCAACTRTRLTAEGRVRTCLFSHEETDLLDLMRGGGSDEDIADRWRAAQWGKQAGHGMNRPDFVQPDRPMSAIGG
ncbi:GTP 3',8-cyclase MoaA [Helcobacillus massiliensis]|nr:MULTISPECIES: GTP 3',8-cyclase MoaA [Helcobacillus]MCG7426100.1 GTP 3',8-cyclase MoaA [Helcobacillus sp. ACRRO]MCT1558734.1 GTP 3',8-cyclase MoaA [Helcobacillus massiliensis]MCT2037460.1 GTP 3',8-cyclase MoaA [Helcobacillus massiliensis]MCT2332974.1 GTP 3',8-cyclase MoaA [Helcobacillus massiliensis]MDK7741470.1 GTP 3',8-cyclase MoaA [Helcobacillus massiliensis]